MAVSRPVPAAPLRPPPRAVSMVTGGGPLTPAPPPPFVPPPLCLGGLRPPGQPATPEGEPRPEGGTDLWGGPHSSGGVGRIAPWRVFNPLGGVGGGINPLEGFVPPRGP